MAAMGTQMNTAFNRLLAGLALAVPAAAWADPQTAADAAVVPEGLTLQLYASAIPQARHLAVKEDGTVAVGTRADAVHLLRDTTGDGRADWRHEIGGLESPNGVAWLGDDLYIGETARVLKAADVLARVAANKPVSLEVALDGFPTSKHHGARVIAFDESGRLHISLGVPCNICMPPDPELTGTIRSYDLDSGSGYSVAYGFRNSVGFDWHPGTGEMWATDHGRDWMGDDLPSDELNRIREPGLHFGYPYCHQGDLPDPEFDDRPCADFEPPALKTGPHVANNGIHFYRGDAIGALAGKAFIALHGSWNRSTKIGYRVDMISFNDDGSQVSERSILVDGWLDGDDVLARPVDIEQLPDGSLLVSDDYKGAVYRILPLDG